MPPHWWRPIKDNPGHGAGGKDAVVKLKSKKTNQRYEIVSSATKPSDDAIFLVDDELEQA